MTERFALDEDKAREWIAQALYGYEGERDERYQSLCEIDDAYDPRTLYETGSGTFNIVADARDAGAVTGPGTVDYEHSSAGYVEHGYTWIVRPEGTTLKLCSLYEDLRHCGDPDAPPGAEAALGVLREAVNVANSLLDDLAAYVVALPLAVRAPEFAGAHPCHGDVDEHGTCGRCEQAVGDESEGCACCQISRDGDPDAECPRCGHLNDSHGG